MRVLSGLPILFPQETNFLIISEDDCVYQLQFILIKMKNLINQCIRSVIVIPRTRFSTGPDNNSARKAVLSLPCF